MTQTIATRNELKSVLVAAQTPHTIEVSHIFGSEYIQIDGMHFRVSDHSKKTNDVYELGVNDFRSYSDLYNQLVVMGIDLSDKSNEETIFKSNMSEKITKSESGYYVLPNGSMFATVDAALNNAWKTRNK
jgi:hypothetical protein